MRESMARCGSKPQLHLAIPFIWTSLEAGRPPNPNSITQFRSSRNPRRRLVCLLSPTLLKDSGSFNFVGGLQASKAHLHRCLEEVTDFILISQFRQSLAGLQNLPLSRPSKISQSFYSSFAISPKASRSLRLNLILQLHSFRNPYCGLAGLQTPTPSPHSRNPQGFHVYFAVPFISHMVLYSCVEVSESCVLLVASLDFFKSSQQTHFNFIIETR